MNEAVSKTRKKKSPARKATAKKVLAKKATKHAVRKSTKRTVRARAAAAYVSKLRVETITPKEIPSPFMSEMAIASTKKEKLKVVARHLMTPRALITLVRFDADEVAVQVARYGGVASIIVGTALMIHMAAAPIDNSVASSYDQTAAVMLAGSDTARDSAMVATVESAQSDMVPRSVVETVVTRSMLLTASLGVVSIGLVLLLLSHYLYFSRRKSNLV